MNSKRILTLKGIFCVTTIVGIYLGLNYVPSVQKFERSFIALEANRLSIANDRFLKQASGPQFQDHDAAELLVARLSASKGRYVFDEHRLTDLDQDNKLEFLLPGNNGCYAIADEGLGVALSNSKKNWMSMADYEASCRAESERNKVLGKLVLLLGCILSAACLLKRQARKGVRNRFRPIT